MLESAVFLCQFLESENGVNCMKLPRTHEVQNVDEISWERLL